MSSFGGATKARSVSRAYTSLHLIGGIDIDASTRCDQMKPQRLPDLKTEGGAVFGGSVAILGDMCLNGTLYGNVGGNLSGNLMGDISVEGDLDIGGNLSVMDGIISNLEADIVCINDELFVNVISPKTGTVIDLGNIVVNDIIINGSISGNISVDIGNVTMLDLDLLTANIVCVRDELQVNLIVPKTGDVIQVDANLEPAGNVLYDFGSPTARWDNIYGNTVYTSFLDGLSPITAKTDLLPSNDLEWNLGISAQRWKTICVGNIDNTGTLNGNLITGNNIVIQQNVNADILIGNVVITDVINGDGAGVIIEGVLALDSSLTANVMTANVGCFKEGSFESISPKIPATDIILYGNIIPAPFQYSYLGSLTNKIEKLFVNDVIVCGTLSGNVSVGVGNVITTDSITSNIVCINDELIVNIINEKTLDSGVIIDGVIHKDATIDANVVTCNILEARLTFDYKRTVVNTPTYMIDQTDDIIAVKYTAIGIVTLTLPQISTLVRKRKRYAIVDEAGFAGTNAIIINTSGSDKIFAGPSWMLSGDFNAVQIYCDEVDNWFAI